MPNRNYITGRNFEYRVKAYLESLGYFVMRSCGSKGVYDLIAVPPANKNKIPISFVTGKALLIQCKKRDYVHPEEMERLQKTSRKLDAQAFVVTRTERRKFLFKLI
jgi:Holliday junction resolvase